MGILGKIDKRIIMGIAIVILLLLVGGAILLFNKKDPEGEKPNADAVKFKEDYAKLNGKENSKGSKYPIVEIEEDNPFRYITEEKAVEMLESGTGLIYFGFDTCPWCRNLVPNLVNAAESTGLETISYLDILDIRSAITYENKSVVVTKEGSDSYYNLLGLLNDYLEDYFVTDAKGKKHSTLEKRLYAPTLVAVVDGKIVGFHEGTLAEHDNGYDTLDDKQIEDLNKILVELMTKVSDSSCDGKC